MALFRRKQGRVATVTTMARFSEADRERGMDMLEAAEAVFVGLGAPSRLGTALFSAAASGMGVDDENTVYGVAAGASLMGYACRMAEPASELPKADRRAIADQLVFTDSGELDYDAIVDEPERLGRLLELTGSVADDRAGIAALAGASEGAWAAFSTTATYQLHRNLVRNGVPKRLLPPHNALENLLRLGYAIRVIDEVAGEVPADKAGQPLGRAEARRPPAIVDQDEEPPPHVPLDVEEWLSDAGSVCTHEFEPFAERLLELATLERLDIASVIDRLLGESPSEVLGDDVVTAMSNTRMGYALRNREVQLLDHTDYIAPADTIAMLLDERISNAGVNMAVIHGVMHDALVLGFEGRRDGLYEATPGTTPAVRRQAIESWASKHFPGDDPRTGREVTVDLLEYGYFLHRLFEIRPDCLEDWS
jgi:hypothetical protein